MRTMNRQIRVVGLAIVVLFLALFLQLNYVQVVRANALDTHTDNTRQVVTEYERARGAIISADGVTLAQSVPSNDAYKYLRQYPTGALFGQLTGYFSFTYGTDGLERQYNNVLTGQSTPISNELKHLFSTKSPTENLRLTVSDKLQQVAATALAGRQGAVVAIDPSTGAILAMYSNPSYDPSPLAAHNQTNVQAAWKALLAQPGNPLVAGTYRQRFFPGSTFKIVTASAVYDHNPALATKNYPVLAGLPLPGTNQQLHNFGGEVCGGQLLALFTVSCDSGFGQIGLDLGAANLSAEAQAFGFNQTPPIDLPGAAQSSFPALSTFNQNQAALAKSAIGQESVQTTPLGMALVAAAVADNGTIMTPHLLDQVTDSQGTVVSTYQPKRWLQATSAATAKQMTNLMLSVVQGAKGTGTAARIPGIQVAGKTGTAQTGGPTIETWFAAFAPVPNPKIAVAVLVENQPSGNAYQGGTIAAPVAKTVIQSFLGTP
jgi:peptidoglycan glycosyltransferase